MGFMKAPKAPKPSAEETAMVERQRRELDEEMEEQEKRLKAVARGTLGTKSLLARALLLKKQAQAEGKVARVHCLAAV